LSDGYDRARISVRAEMQQLRQPVALAGSIH
jgi:hypothetical protein